MTTKIKIKEDVGDVTITSPVDGQVLTLSGGNIVNATPSAGGHVIQDEGTGLTARANLNFIGAGVTAADDSANNRTNVTIPGGSGSGDVVGPASAVDGHLAVFDGITGKLIKDGGAVPTGGTAYAFALDVPPTSPHAKDDEFTGTSLDAKWTNPATSTRTLTLSLANGWLQFEPSDAGSGSIATKGGYGIRQDAPTGSFSISAKIAYAPRGNDLRAGIFVATTTGAKANQLGIQDSQNMGVDALGIPYSETADWGAYDGFVVARTAGGAGALMWHKIVWDAATSTLYFYYSQNGMFWALHTTRASMTQPNRIGLAMYSNSTAIYADQQVAFDWFRVTEP